MGKKVTNPAVNLKKKMAALRKRETKNCIPTINVPKDYKPDGSASNWDGAKEYREMVPEPVYKHIKVKNKPKHKRPWYFLTKKETKKISQNRMSTKMTHDDYINGYLDYKLEKWKKLHPEPRTDDLFYKEEHPKWIADYESAHDKIVSMLSKKYVHKYTPKVINNIFDSRAKYSKSAYKQAA